MTKKTIFLNKLQELLPNQIILFDVIAAYPLMTVPADIWQETAQAFHNLKSRFVAIWAMESKNKIFVTATFENSGIYYSMRTYLEINNLKLSSITPIFAGANRMERHTMDLFGIVFINHPDQRRWIRHNAWNANIFPLRKNCKSSNQTIEQKITPSDFTYPFHKIYGSGTFEIPVGPIHAGIIEPGHFRFQVAGEDVIQLEERLGYVHKGIEKIAEDKDPSALLKLANRISGDSAVSYSWCVAKALENIAQIEIPERAAFLRAIMCERERIANHLWDIAATCNDVGFSCAYFQLGRLKEIFVRNNFKYFAHRLMMDTICFGGVNYDLNKHMINAMFDELKILQKELNDLYPIFAGNSSLHDRLKTTGILSFEMANKLGVTGYVGRASGYKYDLRVDSAYFPYDQFKIVVPVFSAGDVLSRVQVRSNEITNSLQLLYELLSKLPSGDIKAKLPSNIFSGESISLIEGWRGEIFVYTALNQHGTVDRFFLRDPSWFSWAALEKLIHGNIVPDFPVCNKSINGTYSGVDL